MRRGKIGHHHHVAGPYLIRFAQVAAWREDHRKNPNGFQVDRVVALAMKNKPSVDIGSEVCPSATLSFGDLSDLSNLAASLFDIERSGPDCLLKGGGFSIKINEQGIVHDSC
jgi:hypothetical protein